KLDFDGFVARWKASGARATDVAPIPLAYRIEMPDDPSLESTYRTGLLYGKGPYLLQHLGKAVGDDAFKKFLGTAQERYRWKFASTKQLAELLSEMTQKDWLPFFEKNYWGLGMPSD